MNLFSAKAMRSISFRINMLIFVSVFFVLLEFGGNFYFNKKVSERISKIYLSHKIVDRIETDLKLADSLSSLFNAGGDNLVGREAQDIFKTQLKEIRSTLTESLQDRSLPRELTERFLQAQERLGQVEHAGDQIFARLDTADASGSQKDVFLFDHNKIQLLESLDKIRVGLNGLALEAFEGAYQERLIPIWSGIGLVLALSALISFVGLRLSRHLVRSVRGLVQATNAFSGGDLAIRAPILADDEVGRLTKSFNQMAETHQLSQSRLADALEELKSKQMQLVQTGKLAALGEMSSGVAHELNNPLLLIKGFNNRIKAAFKKNGAVTFAEIQDSVSEVDQNCDRMRSIIQHFRDFSRQAEKRFSVIAINEVVNKSFTLLSTQLRLLSILVHQELSLDDPRISGDANRLEQVFINLIANARDALESLSEDQPRVIRACTRIESGWVIVEFTDNGPGIEAANIEKIFNPFFTTKEVGKGTGLGLSISHGIVKEHGGELGCTSVVGQGSTFYVRLPLWEPGGHGTQIVSD